MSGQQMTSCTPDTCNIRRVLVWKVKVKFVRQIVVLKKKTSGYLPVVFQYVLPLELYHWLIDSWTFLKIWDLGDLGTWPVLKEALEIAIRIESWIPRKRLLHPILYKGTEVDKWVHMWYGKNTIWDKNSIFSFNSYP